MSKQEEIKVAEMVRHWHRTGRPERAHALKEKFKAGEKIPYELLDPVGIKSEKEVEGELVVPPRSGRGSGVVEWRKFAEKTSDLAPEILKKMQRDEIVEFLEEREILPKEENADNSEEEE